MIENSSQNPESLTHLNHPILYAFYYSSSSENWLKILHSRIGHVNLRTACLGLKRKSFFVGLGQAIKGRFYLGHSDLLTGDLIDVVFLKSLRLFSMTRKPRPAMCDLRAFREMSKKHTSRETKLRCGSCGEVGRVAFKDQPLGEPPLAPTVIEGSFSARIERGTGMSILTCTRCGFQNRLL